MKVLISGGGTVGKKLAEVLGKEKHDIVVIERDDKKAEALAEELDALVLKGDASDPKILKDAEAGKADALVAMTDDDKTNLMICEVGKSLKVPMIVARVNSTEDEAVFTKLGITATINTTTAVVFAFKKALEKPGERAIGLIAGDKLEILEKTVQKNSPIQKKGLADIKDFSVISVYRDGDVVRLKADTRLQESDVVTLCASVDKVKKVNEMF